MKLLYMTPGIYNSGGTERVLSMKVNYLIEKYGFKIVIVTTDQKDRGRFFNFNAQITHYDLNINYCDDISLPLIKLSFIRRKKNREYKVKLLDIIEKEKPDICISMFGKEFDFLPQLNLPCKIVAELHFSQKFRENSYLSVHKGFLWKIIARYRTRQMIKTSQSFDRVVVLTKEDLKSWCQTSDNVVQIYNPLPYESDLQSNLDAKTFISVGRLSPQKNYESLIVAWAKVQQKHPDWEINVWGDGELHSFLEEMIKKYHVEKTFHLCGKTRNVDKEYLNSSAFIMSSRYEGFPMVLLEASSFGLPLISYDCYCGPKDIIDDGKNGYLVPFGDENKLADSMCKLIEEKSLRRRMGTMSKEKSLQFSQEKILPLWPRFFENLLYSK